MKQLNIEDLSSPSAELLAIINLYLRNYVSTSFLGQVTEIYDENGSARVDVEAINEFRGDDGNLLPRKKILNLMVGMTGGSAWTVSYPVSKGDIGLCVTSKFDLTSFLDSGKPEVTKLSRVFDAADSVFIPLGLFLQPEITVDFEIRSKDEKTVITLSPDGNINVISKGDIAVEASGAVTVSTDNKAVIECREAEIKADTKASINSPLVEIGAGALESLVKGQSFMQFFNLHTHTGNAGAPTSVPVVPMTAAQLSTEVKSS